MEVGHKAFTQKKPEQLVYLEVGAGNGGMLLSISDDGFRFRAVSPVRAGGNVPFAFSLDGSHRLEGAGTIEWLEEDGKSGGMRFTEVSDEFRAAVADWLSSPSSRHSPGREVTPAASTPLDTMEKIRQELRSGYPAAGPQAEPASAANDSKPRPDPGFPRRSISDQELKPAFSKRNAETRGPRTASKLFPLPAPNPAETAKPVTTSSAFVKPPQESRPAPAAPIAPAVLRASVAPTARALPGASVVLANPAESQAGSPGRPYIPPLEDSFEHAWERAKLTAPPDSPHLSRAAAGSIIAVALAIILGALAYNFRQDIGSVFIQLGQEISGDHPSAAPAATQETKPDNRPQDQPNAERKSLDAASGSQSSSADASSVARPAGTSANPGRAGVAPANGSTATKDGVSPAGGAQDSGSTPVPHNAMRSQGNLPAQLPAESASRVGTSEESGSGQEEFNAAREILRGSNRQRELPRAVDLLWSGVRKGYVPAEVTLADLFLRGDGVERNCDQARVLLVAASKKGSFDARQILERMAEQGCE